MVKHRAASLDAVFAALADPIRRGILERLAQGETSVGELAAPHKVSAPAISRHLRVLESAGLMERTKRGRVHNCRLRTEPMSEAQQWLAEHKAFWESRLDRLESFLEEQE